MNYVVLSHRHRPPPDHSVQQDLGSIADIENERGEHDSSASLLISSDPCPVFQLFSNLRCVVGPSQLIGLGSICVVLRAQSVSVISGGKTLWSEE